MTTVILLPGILTPGSVRFAPLVAELELATCEIKELEVYSGPQVPDDYSLMMEVEGLDRFVSECGHERFHLYGYSFGAAIALAYAAENGHKVLSMALDEPATDFSDEDRNEIHAQGLAGLADLPPDERMRMFVQTLIRPGVELGPPPPPPPIPAMALRPAGVAAAAREVEQYRVDERRLCSYSGAMYFSYGSLSHARWESMAARMPTRFARCSVERYEGRHHLDTSHQAEPGRVANALRELWQQ